MNPYLSFLIGVICAGVGGDLFVRGLVGLARWARISAAIIGTTVAAFATSSPEFAVALESSTAGQPEISLGDVLGSNVVNIALILGIALCISPIQTPRSSVRRDFPAAILLLFLFVLIGCDGIISRLEGAVLLILFFEWLFCVVEEAGQERARSQPSTEKHFIALAIVQAIIGVGFLIGSGHFIVGGARGIALVFGIPEFVIGATVVAVGTSMPELATTLISKLRGHDDIGLGTIIGSNIFNGLFIVGITALICPIKVDPVPTGIMLGFGLAATVLAYPNKHGLIGRSRGVMLLALYGAYVILLLKQGRATP